MSRETNNCAQYKVAGDNLLHTNTKLADDFDISAKQQYELRDPPSEDCLINAVDFMNRCVNLTPTDHPKLAGRILNLAQMILQLYELSSKLETLLLAIETIERATSLITVNHKYFLNLISIYANLPNYQFTLPKEEWLLNDAISKFEEAPPRLFSSDPALLQLFGNILFRRYELSENLTDLQGAIEINEKLVASQALGQVRAVSLLNLAQLYGNLYERDPQIRYLRLAVERGQQALKDPTSKLSGEAPFLGALSQALMNSFEHGGKQEDVDEAILLGESAIQKASDNDQVTAGWMNNLGLCYEHRFELVGDVSDLKRAIQLTEYSLELTPKDDRHFLRRTNNLANQLGRRFEWTGESEYLHEAIQKLEVIPGSKGINLSDHSTCLSNLSFLLIQRFERRMEIGDLDNSIEHGKKSIKKTPPSHADLPSRWNSLGIALRLRYEQTRLNEDIEEAIQFGEKAKSFLNELGPARGTWLSNLALSYLRRFEEDKDQRDLEEAIRLTEESMNCPNNLPDRANRLVNLGNLLILRYTLLETPTNYISRALKCYKEAAGIPNAIPLQRIRATRSAIRILHKSGEWDQMRLLGEEAMRLIPLVCGRYITRQDQQRAMLNISGLAADVCSILLKEGQTDKALCQLEYGKAVLIGYTIDNREDLVTLKAENPDLAKRYEDLRSKLYLQPTVQAYHIAETRMRERRTAAYDMEECLNKIRLIKHHENFLRGLSLEEMKTCAKEGPIVVVNVTDIGSDAIIVSTSKVWKLPLPQMNFTTSPDFIYNAIKAFGSFDRDFLLDRDLEDVTDDNLINNKDALSWLWRSCVKEVLDELKAAKLLDHAHELTRVWWIGAGIASSFPFHAAASSFDNLICVENTLSLIVPSYTPSIKALLHSRQNSKRYAESRHTQRRVIIVTMPTTPGHAKLSGVDRESDAIWKTCQGFYLCTKLPHPTVDVILKSIAISEIVHFACHGMSHGGDPSKSHLLLQKDGDSGPAVDELTVSKISSADDKNLAWISYLSACSTAQTRAPKLADEGIHISSALQVAGFAHVIGSLWQVDDKLCVEVAEKFYEALTKACSQHFCDRAVAESIRSAVMDVRAQNPDPSKWAAYIHSGA